MIGFKQETNFTKTVAQNLEEINPTADMEDEKSLKVPLIQIKSAQTEFNESSSFKVSLNLEMSKKIDGEESIRQNKDDDSPIFELTNKNEGDEETGLLEVRQDFLYKQYFSDLLSLEKEAKQKKTKNKYLKDNIEFKQDDRNFREQWIDRVQIRSKDYLNHPILSYRVQDIRFFDYDQFQQALLYLEADKLVVEEKEKEKKSFDLKSFSYTAFSFSSLLGKAAVGFEKGNLTLISTKNWETLQKQIFKDRISTLSFLSDSSKKNIIYLACGSIDGTLLIVDPATLNTIVKTEANQKKIKVIKADEYYLSLMYSNTSVALLKLDFPCLEEGIPFKLTTLFDYKNEDNQKIADIDVSFKNGLLFIAYKEGKIKIFKETENRKSPWTIGKEFQSKAEIKFIYIEKILSPTECNFVYGRTYLKKSDEKYHSKIFLQTFQTSNNQIPWCIESFEGKIRRKVIPYFNEKNQVPEETAPKSGLHFSFLEKNRLRINRLELSYETNQSSNATLTTGLKKILDILQVAKITPDGKSIICAAKAGFIKHDINLDKVENIQYNYLKDEKENTSNIGIIKSGCFSADGLKFMALSVSRIFIIDLKDNTSFQLNLNINPQNKIDIYSGIFLNTDKKIVLGLGDGRLQIHNIDYDKKETKCIFEFTVHSHQVLDLAFSKLSHFFVSSSADFSVFIHYLSSEKKDTELVYKLQSQLLHKHRNSVRAVEISCDDRYIMSGDYNGALVIFSDTDDQQYKKFASFQFDEEEISSVAFSSDTNFATCGGRKGVAYFISIAQKTLIRKISVFNDARIRSLSFSPDGSILIVAGETCSIKLYDVSVAENKVVISHSSNIIRSIAVSKSSELFAISGDDNKIRVYNLKTGFEIKNFKVHEGASNVLEFSPDDNLLVSGSEDNRLVVIDFSSGQLLKDDEFSGQVRTVAFSRNCRWLSAGSDDQTLNIYDTSDFKKILTYPKNLDNKDKEFYQTFTEKGVEINNQAGSLNFRIRASCFLPDDSKILVGGNSKTILQLTWGQNQKDDITEETKYEVQGTLNVMGLSRDGKHFAVGTETNNLIVLFNISQIQHKWSKFMDPPKKTCGVIAIDFSLDDEWIVACNDMNILYLFSKEKGDVALKLSLEYDVFCLKVLGNQERIIIAGDSKFPEILDFKGKKLTKWIQNSELEHISVSNSGNLIVAAGTKVNIVQLKGSRQLMAFDLKSKNNEKKKCELLCVKFSSNTENIVAAGSKEGHLLLFDIFKAKEIKHLIFPKPITAITHRMENDNEIFIAIALEGGNIKYSKFKLEDLSLDYFSEPENIFHRATITAMDNSYIDCLTSYLDGKATHHLKSNKKVHPNEEKEKEILIVTASNDNTVVLFSLNKNKPIFTLSTHKNAVTQAIFSFDSYFVASCSCESARIIDILSGTETRQFTIASKNCTNVAFSNDNKFLLISDGNGCITIFDINSSEEVRKITLEAKTNSLLSCSNIDNFIVSGPEGIVILKKVLNTNLKISKIIELYEEKKKENDEEFQQKSSLDFGILDLNIAPYPLIASKLHWMIYKNKNPNLYIILENIKHYTSSLNKRREKPEILDWAIISYDSFGMTPWDYFMFIQDIKDNQIESDKNKIEKDKKNAISNTLEYLIAIFLSRKIPALHRITNKNEFMAKIADEYSTDFQKIFKEFHLKVDSISLEALDISGELKYLESKSPHPSSNEVKRILYEMERAKTEKSKNKIKKDREKYDLYLSLITPRDFDILIEQFSSYSMNHPIYQSDLVTHMIGHRWNTEFKRKFHKDIFIYLLFIFVVSVNTLCIFPLKTTYQSEFLRNMSRGLDILIIFIFIFIYFINEYNELSVSGIRHYKSFWNILDSLVIIVGLLFCILDLSMWDDFQSKNLLRTTKVFCCLFFLGSWLRLLDFARGISRTSALIRVVTRVLEDMLGFLLVLFFLLIVFSLSTYILQTSYEDNTPWTYIKIFYYILIGDFDDFKKLEPDTSLDIDLYFFVILGVTLFLVIVMLNLIIAMIADSFEKVMSLEKQADAFEKIQLIHERRSRLNNTDIKAYQEKTNETYVYMIAKDESREQDDLDERLRHKINKIGKKQKELKLKFNSYAMTSKEALLKISTSIDGILGKLTSSEARLSIIEEQSKSWRHDDPTQKLKEDTEKKGTSNKKKNSLNTKKK